MILFRAYVAANDQSAAEAVARGYLPSLKKLAPFRVKLVQPYWKFHGQYEVLLEAAGSSADQVKAISELVTLIGVSPQQASGTEAIWSDVNDDFPLTCAKWVHVEVI